MKSIAKENCPAFFSYNKQKSPESGKRKKPEYENNKEAAALR
jgi:hypothetical protein